MSHSDLDICYGPKFAHKLDLHFPPPSHRPQQPPPPLICYVHGGAWHSEDKSQHSQMAVRLAGLADCPVAVPNYRLTLKSPTPDGTLHHPAHAEDVLLALTYLCNSADGRYDPATIHLIGHSCGTHILSSIFLDSSPVTPSLTPEPAVLAAVRAIVVCEGIYDLDLLLASFPAYRERFVASAFGERDSFSAFSTSAFPLRADGAHIRWFVVHSAGDTLVDFAQSHTFYNHLHSLYESSASPPTSHVHHDWDTLTEGHFDVPRSEAFLKMVADYVRGNFQ